MLDQETNNAGGAVLIGPNDPSPIDLANGDGRSQVVMCADHATNIIPKGLNGLGLPPEELDRYIALDIGAADVARRLELLFDTPAILASYSRLVIDFNRPRDDHTSVRVIGDSTVIPVNRRLSPMQLYARAAAFFRPYHQAITDAIEARQYGTRCTVVISIHSFTDAAGLPKDTGSTVVSMISAKASASHMPISSKGSLHWCGRMPNDLTVSRRSRERVKSSPMEQAHTTRF